MIGFRADVPFPAIVGQDRLKRALLATAVNDAIDGLLIRGEKGTAKSTAVRGLVDLLPTQRAVADCPYGCPPEDRSRQCESCRNRDDLPVEERPVPLVTVPLGATRERVVGSLLLTEALDGRSTFEPGLLARANRGFLYVDEVNLLPDHLVDVLLDAAASGVNRVERDGVSKTHPAEFTLIGTMNPEEGDLRPQFRDRFSIRVEVTGSDDIDERVAIVESTIARDGATESGDGYDEAIGRLRDLITAARDDLADVTLHRSLTETIADVCLDAGVDGHRGDIAAARTARTFAALDGRSEVIEADIEAALGYALPHRLQSRPFEDATPLDDVIDDHFGASDDDTSGDETRRNETDTTQSDADADRSHDGQSGRSGGGSGLDNHDGHDFGDAGAQSVVSDDSWKTPSSGTAHEPEGTSATSGDGGRSESGSSRPQSDSSEGADDADTDRPVRPPASSASGLSSPGSSHAPDLHVALEGGGDNDGSALDSGRVETDPSTDADGPRIRTEPVASPKDVDIGASIRESARRGGEDLERRDLRESIQAGTTAALVVFVVDASASMRPAMRATKATVLELLKESYRERDEVAFVAFAGEDADVLLPPTDSVSLAARHLKDLPVGDRTPLPAGLATAREVIERADPAASVSVVVTDGRTNVATGSPTAATREAAENLGARADEVLVVDASRPDDRAGLIDDIVAAADAREIPLEAFSEESVRSVARSARQ